MSPTEATAIRERLGLSREDLAAELNLTPDVVAAWENGRVRIPGRIAKELQWRSADAERHAAMASSGLPECPWMAAWATESVSDDVKSQTAHVERAAEHQKSCETCTARLRYLDERFPPMPRPPMPVWLETLGWIADNVAKLPRWGQPAAYRAVRERRGEQRVTKDEV